MKPAEQRSVRNLLTDLNASNACVVRSRGQLNLRGNPTPADVARCKQLRPLLERWMELTYPTHYNFYDEALEHTVACQRVALTFNAHVTGTIEKGEQREA